MAQDAIVRLKVESKEYDAQIAHARSGLLALEKSCRENGKTMENLTNDQLQYVRALGQMQTTSRTAKGRLSEMTQAFTDLRVQQSRLTEEERKGAYGKALSASLEQLKTRIRDTKTELQSISKELEDSPLSGSNTAAFSKMDGALSVLGGNLMTKAITVAADGVKELVSSMSDMVKEGVEMAKAAEGIRNAFSRLNRADLLDELREATHGTVTDIELMKQAVKFNDFRLSLDEMGTMLAFAQQKAKDTGQSVDYMVDSIVTGLGRQSLMILDNLGLSASEIRERMKETGDMTTAVGQIIREQMSSAGEYVETAADRETRANAELKNAMEELGRTFQPLNEAANTFWNDMKIGAINALNEIRPLINEMTAAGRVRNAEGRYGGSDKISSQLDILSGMKTEKGRQAQYEAQLAKYDEVIGDLKFKRSAFTMKGTKDQNDKYQINELSTRIKALETMKANYIAGADKIFNPPAVKTPAETTQASPITTSQPAAVAIYDPNALTKLQTELEGTTPVEKVAPLRSSLSASSWEDFSTFAAEEMGKTMADALAENQRNIENSGVGAKYDPTEDLNELTTVGTNITKGVTQLTTGLKSLGVELPSEVDEVVGVINGLCSVIQGVQTIISVFSTSTETANTIALDANTAAVAALTSAVVTNSATNLIPLAHGGIAHAANGFIGGNIFTGDNIPVAVNSGELILNRAQQGNLASQLQNTSQQQQPMQPWLDGEKIYLGLNNYLHSIGKGEIVTAS